MHPDKPLMATLELGDRSAVLSEDGLYRYRLERRWGTGRPVAFIMLNPSTADAELDDPTIRRCIGFAKRLGAGALAVGNLYAWRATRPDDLGSAVDPVGPDNDRHLREIAFEASDVIAAWGAHWTADVRGPRVEVGLLDALNGRPLWALGTSKGGKPRHPLYLRGDSPLLTYREGTRS